MPYFWREYFYRSRRLYFLVGVIFFIGLILGALNVSFLPQAQAQELLGFLDGFLSSLDAFKADNPTLEVICLQNLKFLLVPWLLGLTVVGVPLIILIILLAGFAFGFTLNFFFTKKALTGVLLVVLAVLPPQLLLLPALLTVAGTALSFSFWLVRRKSEPYPSFSQRFLSYTLLFLLGALAAVGASFLEAYYSPAIMRLIVTHF